MFHKNDKILLEEKIVNQKRREIVMSTRNRQLVVFIKGEPYYAAQKAEDELGMTYSALRNQVTMGRIKSEIPPGKRQAYYRGKDVERVANEMRMLMSSNSYVTGQFRQMIENDLLETTKISDMIFGGHIDIERQKRWLEKNSEIGYIVESEGKIVGYLIIAPLQPEKIEKLLTEEESSIIMDASEIETFEPGKPLYLYGIAIGVLPGLTRAEKRVYGAKLVGGLLDVVTNWGRRGIILDTIVARSTKPDGIQLLRNLGFTQIPSTTEKKDFVLRVETSGSKPAMLYKRALQESGHWKPEPFSFDTWITQEKTK
jgi:hypothetical protein